MKKNIRLLFTLAILLASLHVGCLKAQRIIDTSYYRYAHTPIAHECWQPAWGYDDRDGAGARVIDSVSMCIKDKVGFAAVYSEAIVRDNDCVQDVLHSTMADIYGYWQIPLSHSNMDIYGFAIFLDSIKEYHLGEYLKIYICEKSEDGTHFETLDSIVLDESTRGVRRYMVHPITRSLQDHEWEYDSINYTLYPVPFEDCTLYNELAQVWEVYFDHPVHIGDSNLYWNWQFMTCHTSLYFSFRRQDLLVGPFVACTRCFDSNCAFSDFAQSWDHVMAITEPLPQWEQDRMELLITDVVGDPDPEDPEDPDNPGGDEGIGEAVGSQQSAVRIYPNPASNSTVVTCDAEIQELTLRDINGRLIRTLRNCGTSTTLDTSALTPGLYTLQVTTPSGTTTRKLAIK